MLRALTLAATRIFARALLPNWLGSLAAALLACAVLRGVTALLLTVPFADFAAAFSGCGLRGAPDPSQGTLQCNLGS
jgi:hypothetical protein